MQRQPGLASQREFPTVDTTHVYFSKHALDRLAERKITTGHLMDALSKGIALKRYSKENGRSNRYVVRSKDLRIVCEVSSNAIHVLTALWADQLDAQSA